MIKLLGYDIAYSLEPDTIAYLISCGADERLFRSSYLNIWNSIKYMITVTINTHRRMAAFPLGIIWLNDTYPFIPQYDFIHDFQKLFPLGFFCRNYTRYR